MHSLVSIIIIILLLITLINTQDSNNSTLIESNITSYKLNFEFETVLLKKDILLSQLEQIKQSLSQSKEDLSEETLQKINLINSRIHQLKTLENFFKSSFKALEFITSFNVSSDNNLLFDEIKKENDYLIKNSLDLAFREKEGDFREEVRDFSNSTDNLAKDLVGNVLNQLDGAVDRLEDEMHRKDESMNEEKKKGKVEAVVKIDGEEELEGSDTEGDVNSGEDVSCDEIAVNQGKFADTTVQGHSISDSPMTQSSSSKSNNDNNSTQSSISPNSISSNEKQLQHSPSSISNSLPSHPSNSKPQKQHSSSSVHAPKLIDTENNVYVLSRNSDYTKYIEDTGLFSDFVLLVTTSFLLGYIFDRLKLPPFFGYILSGTLLGPSYADKIQRLVQMETLGIFGILFMLFVLGLEFPVEQVKKFWKVTVFGGTGIAVLCILCIVLVGFIFGFALNQSIFFGSVVVLSSTSVVLKCIESEKDTKNAKAILTILVQQDILVGLFLALLPVLAKDVDYSHLLYSICKVIVYNLCFMICTLFLGKLITPLVLKLLKLTQSAELLLLGIFCFCFCFLLLSEYFSISIEVGCFMAGVVIGEKRLSSETKKHLMERIEAARDLFSCIFFASIGFHIYPSFLLNQAPLLLAVTIGIMSFKTIIGFLVLRYGLKFSSFSSCVISLVTSQISEFAFVMCSRAKSLQLINRNSYYVIIGATSLSLIFTPFIWKFVSLCLDGLKSPVKSRFHKDDYDFGGIGIDKSGSDDNLDLTFKYSGRKSSGAGFGTKRDHVTVNVGDKLDYVEVF